MQGCNFLCMSVSSQEILEQESFVPKKHGMEEADVDGLLANEEVSEQRLLKQSAWLFRACIFTINFFHLEVWKKTQVISY